MNWAAAVLLALLFLSSGIWKITDVTGWAVRLTQAKVPEWLSIPGTIAIGVTETVAGVFLLAPRLRRWGALLSGALLAVFMVYFAIFYNDLRGADCSCFPWLKRVVGPGFFIGDGAMLVGAAIAGVWARRSEGLRRGVDPGHSHSLRGGLVRCGGRAASRGGGAGAITVDGRPYEIGKGKVLVYFFNPLCTHCIEVAKRMSKLEWDGRRWWRSRSNCRSSRRGSWRTPA